MQYIQHLLNLIIALATRQSQLIAENIALKQQIIVLKRTTKRARIRDSDRLFWVLMRRLHKDWMNHLFIVTPQTVTRWHRHASPKELALSAPEGRQERVSEGLTCFY